MSYTPANPRFFPRCANCKLNRAEHCPCNVPEDRAKGKWIIGMCSDWTPKYPRVWKLLTWVDVQEEKLRFRIINQLDKLDRWCWADLVMWAERYRPFSEVGRVRQCMPNGYPYCGKCEKFLPPEGQCKNLKNPEWSREKGMWIEKEVD